MKIADSHTDVLTNLKGNNLKNYFKNLTKIKTKLINCAIFTTKPKLNLIKIKKLIKKIKDKNFIFSIEDIGFIKNKKQLLNLLKLKPFSVSLTWNYSNQFGGGANSKQGLTKLGKEAIKIIERAFVLIDTAHMNKKTFYQFVKLTKNPIYNSHSNIYSLHKHTRNLTNKQIEIIKKTNGFLGLTIYQKFISKHKITAVEIAKQIDFLIKNYGDDFFGFGTDIFGFDDEFLPTDISNYLELSKVEEQLQKLGHSSKTIENIFYNNYKNFVDRLSKHKS